MSVWKKCPSAFFVLFFFKGLLALVSLSGNAGYGVFNRFQPFSAVLKCFEPFSDVFCCFNFSAIFNAFTPFHPFSIIFTVFSYFKPVSTVLSCFQQFSTNFNRLFKTVFNCFMMFSTVFTQFLTLFNHLNCLNLF